MGRVFFSQVLEGVATFWRVYRQDGVTVGLTSHDRDLRFDGILHRAAPGMLPSAIRRTAGFSSDSAEVQGALTHDSIPAAALADGLFDGARVEIGVVDWENLESAILYRGEIGAVSEEAGSFSAELRSAKAELEADTVPRTSPTCRARFCGPGCTLSAARFTHEAVLEFVDFEANRVGFQTAPPFGQFANGSLRWLDGPHAGITMQVLNADAEGLVLDMTLDPALGPGATALLREGCDHTFQTCKEQFANSVNFQGEPFVPGNDLITRYPTSAI